MRDFFEHPHTLFDVIVTLDDGTVHCLRDQQQQGYNVRPLRGDVVRANPLTRGAL